MLDLFVYLKHHFFDLFMQHLPPAEFHVDEYMYSPLTKCIQITKITIIYHTRPVVSTVLTSLEAVGGG